MIAKIRQTADRFLRDEDGAVTVDWVVLTAAVVGLGLVIGPTIGQNTVGVSEDIAGVVGGVEVDRYRTGTGGASGTGGEGAEGEGAGGG